MNSKRFYYGIKGGNGIRAVKYNFHRLGIRKIVKYYLHSLLFARDKLYFLLYFPRRSIFRVTKKSVPEKKFLIIWQKQLRTWLAVDSSSLYPYLTGYEPTVVNALRGLIKPGAVFIDVGASIGFYSILAAKLGAKVVALEPDFRSFKVLLYNVEMSGVRDRVIPIKAAAGSHVGSLKLKLADYPPWSFTTDFLSGNVTMGIVKVPMISIDEVFRSLRLDKVNVIKIDVEGAGVDVVAGAELVLNWFNPHILFEVHRTVRSDELIAINILKKKFNYDYKILEFRNQNNFICHLMPHR